MADFTSPASNAGSVRDDTFPIKPMVAFGLVVLADWLFYNEQIGISAAIFAAALACGSVFVNFAKLDRKRIATAGICVLASLVPAIEEFNTLSLIFIVLALGLSLSLTTNRHLDSVSQQASALCELYLIAPFRLLKDATGVFNLLAAGFTLWFIPVILGSIFVFLFASANPLIAKWISLLNPGDTSSYISVSRILFWVAIASMIWPFIKVWWRGKPVATPAPAEAVPKEQETTSPGVDLFGAATILRSLILFNLLFAVQTVLDATYLWGNATLPADIGYAEYAHRGAYPLIVTALLAAGFVLAAMRPGGPAEQSKIIRPLVYLWVGQNVLLVASSILRLDLYVQIYLLTWMRVAAFIWMLLVGCGLLLIVARIVLNRSNEWLIRANVVTLTATLYVCSLVNFSAVIGDYNVDHSREVTGKGIQVDMNYLLHLGPQALPALDRAIQLRAVDTTLVSRRNSLVQH